MKKSPDSKIKVHRPGWGRGHIGRFFRYFIGIPAGIAVVVSLFFGAQLAYLFSVPIEVVYLLPWLTFFLVMIPIHYQPLLRLRLEDGVVKGLGAGKDLPEGMGSIWVSKVERRIGGGRYQYFITCYDISYGIRAPTKSLYLWEKSPVKARAFAEALARLGQYRIEWSEGTISETRWPDELDLPIIERLQKHDPPAGIALSKLEEVRLSYEDDALDVEWLGIPSYGWKAAFLVATGMSLFMFPLVFFSIKNDSAFETALVTSIIFFVITFLPGMIPMVVALLIRHSLVVTPGEIVETTTYLGRYKKVNRFSPTSIESIYCDQRLLLVCDNEIRKIGGNLLRDGPLVVHAVERALLGLPPTEEHTNLAASESAVRLAPESEESPTSTESKVSEAIW